MQEGTDKRLLRVGRSDVRNALGFFWHDRTKIYVARRSADVDEWAERGFSDGDLRPMAELEAAYRASGALRFVSWCSPKDGCIVRQGARRVTFIYQEEKSVVETLV